MTEEIIKTLIDQLAEHPITEEEIRQKFNEYVEIGYGAERAKSFILTKYGVKAPATQAKNNTPTGPASELTSFEEDNENVTFTAIIESKYERETRDNKTMFYGRLQTNGESVSYSAFREDFPFGSGDEVEFNGAQLSHYNGKPQLTINYRTEQKLLKKNETATQDATIAGIGTSYFGTVNVTGRIMSMRRIEHEKIKNPFWKGLIADESGVIEFLSWEDTLPIEEKEAYTIKGAQAQLYQGTPIMYINKETQVEEAGREVPAYEHLPRYRGATLQEINSGAKNQNHVETHGLIVEIRDGSGLIHRCPECNRVTQRKECRIHGPVTPKNDLRIRAVLDDESGAATALLNREAAEAILGYDLDAALEKARETMDTAIIQEELTDELVGKYLQVSGNVILDDYGAQFLVEEHKLQPSENEHMKDEIKTLWEALQ